MHTKSESHLLICMCIYIYTYVMVYLYDICYVDRVRIFCGVRDLRRKVKGYRALECSLSGLGSGSRVVGAWGGSKLKANLR